MKMTARVLCLFAVALMIAAGCAGTGRTNGGPDAVDTGDPVDTVPQVSPSPSSSTASAATVELAFDAVTVTSDDEVEATVSVSGVDDLYGAEVHLAFDAERLQVVDMAADSDGIQVADGELLDVGYTVVNRADNAAGTIDYAVSQMPPSVGVSGEGPLMRIRFRAVAAGPATLGIADLVLADSQGSAIPVSIGEAEAGVTVE